MQGANISIINGYYVENINLKNINYSKMNQVIWIIQIANAKKIKVDTHQLTIDIFFPFHVTLIQSLS